MTMDDFKRWLDERISILGPELERLLNARNAIERAEAEFGSANVLRPPAEHPPQQQMRVSPGTYTKTGTRVSKDRKKVINVTFNPEEWRRILADIPRILRTNEGRPMRSGAVIKVLYPESLKKDRDRVYAALNQLKTRGTIVKTDEGFILPSDDTQELHNG